MPIGRVYRLNLFIRHPEGTAFRCLHPTTAGAPAAEHTILINTVQERSGKQWGETVHTADRPVAVRPGRPPGPAGSACHVGAECGMRNVMKAELATPAGLQERPGLLLINNGGLLPAEKYSPIYDEPHCY